MRDSVSRLVVRPVKIKVIRNQFDKLRLASGAIKLASIVTAVSAGAAYGDGPICTTVTVHPTTRETTQILDFDVRGDADRPFTSSSVPLAPTAFNAALKANANAQVDRAKVMPLVLTEEHIEFAAQGSDTIQALTFANWQYIDRLVTWGGTSSRNITAPGQAWIDAAHRNGVKIYGNIFLAPTVYGGGINQIEYLIQTNAKGSYIVADKLIELAETQGFDGWFLNQETQGADSALAEEVGKFMDYIQANSGIELIWYDAMTESGDVRWQEELNSANDRFFQNNGRVVSDAMFLDFTPTRDKVRRSRALANKLGRGEFEIYAGALLESFGIAEGDDGLNTTLGTSVGGDQAVSVAMYRPDKESWDAYNNNWNIQDLIRAEEQLYVGQAGDPSNTAQNVIAFSEHAQTFSEDTRWKGFAHHVAAKTPLLRDRFMSNFNYGIGTDYYIRGQRLSTRDWNNMGAQDILPTWRWMVQTDDSTPLRARFDFSDAYIGGSSLRVQGSLDNDTDLPLYLASMGVFDDSKLTLTYKTGEIGASSMQVFITIKGNEQTRIALDVGPTSITGWNQAEFDLSAYAGETLSSIGLRFLGNSDADYKVLIGQIGLIRGERDVLAPVTNVRLQGEPIRLEADRYEVRLMWDHSTGYARDFGDNNLYYYNVYQQFADGSRELLGVTGGEAYWINDLLLEQDQRNATMIIEAVSLEFGVSETRYTLNLP